MLIRHAEKPSDGSPPYGVTVRGEREKESLTVRGWQRAGALANLFAPAGGVFQDPSLARPQFIYASKPLKHNGSRRPVETVMPIAEKLGIRINSNFPKTALESMLEDVFLCDGAVLICWQREYIPKIANYILGNTTTTPRFFPENRFDLVWVFDRDPALAEYAFKQVPQHLLRDDSQTPIIM